MGKAVKMKDEEVVVPTRGRPVQIDPELIEDLTVLVKGKAEALDLSPYFDESTTNVKASGQIHKHFNYMDEKLTEGKRLRLDFANGRIQARIRNVTTEATPSA